MEGGGAEILTQLGCRLQHPDGNTPLAKKQRAAQAHRAGTDDQNLLTHTSSNHGRRNAEPRPSVALLEGLGLHLALINLVA